MAIQSGYKRNLEKDENKIAITVTCATCGEFRTFITHINLKMLLNKEWSTIAWHVQCTKCRHTIEVSLGWHSDEPGHSNIPVSTENPHHTVKDDIGLGGSHN